MPHLSAVEKKLLHYTKRAIKHFNMIQRGDRVLVCLSGGKDSFTMISILELLRQEWHFQFELMAYTLDQAQPGWDDTHLRAYLENKKIPYTIDHKDTYSIVKEKIPEGKTYCSLCSRLRRGTIYQYAIEHGFNKIALGHHRDDMIRTLLMSIFYSGQIKSMPPKLLSDDQKNILIRPLAYCQEKDIIRYATEQKFPIIPCNLCGSQENLMRIKIKNLIDHLEESNPKVPSNILHALSSINPSQLMDNTLFDFKNLEQKQILSDNQGIQDPIEFEIEALDEAESLQQPKQASCHEQ